MRRKPLRLARWITMLLASGITLLVAAILLSTLPATAGTLPARAAPDSAPYAYSDGWHYTQHASPVSTGRAVDLFVDPDFSPYERDRIISAMRQWNYVMNGFVRFEARLLPENPPSMMLAQIRRSGGWVVARVDSRHPIAQHGEGMHALAVTTGNRGGFVYVISDRIGNRDLSGVVMHEFGHVLGAGHDSWGLMAPVYNAAMGRCIDHDAVSLVAQAQRLPVNALNWCVGPGGEFRAPQQAVAPAPAPYPDYRTPMAARQR
jgi:hypothetical protein